VDKRDVAEGIIEELADGADFATLARRHSIGPSKGQGGDLGYLGREAMVKPFTDAAFGLNTGAVTPMPIETRFGWHVIKLEDRRAVKIPSFEELRPQLVRQIRVRVADEVFTKLRRDATIIQFDFNGKAMPKSASR
jgi:peptidyl-prolyl cis-trans isomerase C